jgi:hypothetical protein
MKTIPQILLILLIMAQTTAFAQAIWNGAADTAWYSDSQTKFTITKPEQLAGFAKLVNNGNDFEDKTIKLGSNIMLNDTANWQNWEKSPPANNWEPIGFYFHYTDGECASFKGTFNGNGFVINGAYINNPDKDQQGLFGFIRGSAAIKNLGIAASYINGKEEVGGLVGATDDGTIHSCRNCCPEGKKNIATIDNCYSKASVVGQKDVGGLVGRNDNAFITNSYSTALVAGCEGVGGLVGMNTGMVINSYSKASVTGQRSVGGLIGDHNNNLIINNYSTAFVKGQNEVGGLVGSSLYGRASNSYYDKEASGQSKSVHGEGKTTAEMQSREFADNLSHSAGPLSMNAWIYSAGKYPVLSNRVDSSLSVKSFFESGEGTEAAPYIINTAKQLENLSWLVNLGVDNWDMNFKLGQDIMLNDTANWRNWANNPPANVWTPIGTRIALFDGTFDGSGYAVNGIYADVNPEKHYYKLSQGLFGVIGIGTVKNLGISASYIKGHSYVGGLAGENEDGAISNSYFIGIVEGRSDVGGLVGLNDGTIINSYSASVVNGDRDRRGGGLVGYNNRKGSAISSSYYDKETSDQSDEGKGDGKTTAEMKQKSTYEGWDFDNVWGISGDVNGGYPYLLNYNKSLP